MNTIILIGALVLIAGAVFYFVNKKKDEPAAPSPSPETTPTVTPDNGTPEWSK